MLGNQGIQHMQSSRMHVGHQEWNVYSHSKNPQKSYFRVYLYPAGKKDALHKLPSKKYHKQYKLATCSLRNFVTVDMERHQQQQYPQPCQRHYKACLHTTKKVSFHTLEYSQHKTQHLFQTIFYTPASYQQGNFITRSPLRAYMY